VSGSATGDVFEGITPAAIPFSAPPGYQPVQRSGVSVELGGPWSFYREFWRAHGLPLEGLLKDVGVNVVPGEYLQIPLIVHNDTNEDAVVTIAASVPEGWNEASGGGTYAVAAHQDASLYIRAKSAMTSSKDAQKLVLRAERAGTAIQPITILVYADRGALPQ
jgi:hypothetical protein